MGNRQILIRNPIPMAKGLIDVEMIVLTNTVTSVGEIGCWRCRVNEHSGNVAKLRAPRNGYRYEVML